MHLITVLFRIALSGVFGVAGVTKLIDPRGTRDAVKNFGAPEPLVPAVSLALPIIELTIAAGLLFTDTSRVSALGALLVLILFVVAISVNLARGQTHDCHCFGQLYSRPLGWPTLVRNIVFALGAGFVLWQAATEAPAARANIPNTLAQLNAVQWVSLLGALAAVIAGLIILQRRHEHSAAEGATVPRGLPIN